MTSVDQNLLIVVAFFLALLFFSIKKLAGDLARSQQVVEDRCKEIRRLRWTIHEMEKSFYGDNDSPDDYYDDDGDPPIIDWSYNPPF